MAHIVTANCNDCKYTDCCVVCPVECFYQDSMMLYIDPEDCIDCEACIPECPVQAIFRDEEIPEEFRPPKSTIDYIVLNADKAKELKAAAKEAEKDPAKASALEAAGAGHITEQQPPKEGPACKKK